MYGHILRPYRRLVSPAFTLRTASLRSRCYQTSQSKKQFAADSTHIDTSLNAKPRPFAIERVGGRECHVSWSEEGITKEWRELAAPTIRDGQTQAASTIGSVTGRLTSWLRQMFLPTNYPQSVHRSYAPFHILQFFETTFGTVVSVLCNQALLTSVGVSAEGSVFGAVAVQWIIKDGAGEIAKLFFIRHCAAFFDSHPKSFTLAGESLVALGSGLQIATLLVPPTPGYFLLCAAGGNVFKLVGYAIWFTTHIKWVRYFAAQGNMGDVAAKDESQTSIAQLVGYAAGIGLLSVSHAPAYLYALYTLLTPAHLMMTALMMRVATFEVLTMPRLGLLARAYAGEDGAAGVRSLREIERADETGVFGEYYKRKEDRLVELAPRVSEVVGRDVGADSARWELCTRVFQDEKYVLYPVAPPTQRIAVFFHPDAALDDMLRAVMHAARLRMLLGDGSSVEDTPALRPALADSLSWTRAHFDAFKHELEDKGWRTDEIAFADRGHRLLWGKEADRDP
ncbi:hypothetical protein IEO21_10415 [Rhodonia placenta]|uniref:DUF647-domain-containing protein n=1 Tax=Rhodonia placenta TaxID=104341 RepID=A0A8H7TXJ5_9APHY|nr:hypothetical protein IEO21_10415 [Postia placenta]